MLKKYFALWAMVSMAFLLGCEKAHFIPTTTVTTTSTTTTTGYESYFPLAPGHFAAFRINTHTEENGVTEESSYENWRYRGWLSLTATLEVFWIEVISDFVSTNYYYREDASGLYTHGSGDQPTTESELLLKYPLQVGTSWESQNGLNRVLTEEGVWTDAGYFICLKVNYETLPGGWEYCWFQKNGGLIKQSAGYAGVGINWLTREVISKNF